MSILSPRARPSAIPARVARLANLLVVGDSVLPDQTAADLEQAGVVTVVASSGRAALTQATNMAPDVVIVGEDTVQDMPENELVAELLAVSARRPKVVVMGKPGSRAAGSRLPRDEPNADTVYLPTDVDAADLIEHIRPSLRPVSVPPLAPPRPALTEHRLSEEIGRELQRAKIARRSGVLAVVSVAELEQIHTRLGHKAEQAVAAAFDEFFAQDAQVLEQHSSRSDGGFLLLMPETDLATARDRLERLSRRVAGTVLDVQGEHVRLTPVVGYAAFAGASSAQELCERVTAALNDAALHLDLVPVGYSQAFAPVVVPMVAKRDRLLSLIDRLRSPMQIAFTWALLVSLPFIVYVAFWYAGFDLTTITYPLVAAALAATAAALWIENFKAVGTVELPPELDAAYPPVTAIIAAYLPNEAATIVDTVNSVLGQDYPGQVQVILAYNTPQLLPVEATLADLAAHDSRLLLLRVNSSTSKAQNVNAALAHVQGEFVGVFDADHHPAQGSFARAWRWLSHGHDVVQGHCVVRNGEGSWIARLIAVEFETIYAVSHPGRARLHGFGIFGGSNGYWRTESLRQIRMQGSMLTEDIDSSMRSLLDGYSIVSDPGLISTELAPTTMRALWNQRMRWAQGWTQTARRHLRPALTSDVLGLRQKIGAAFLLGWTQVVPWVTFQVIPILCFTAWRDGGFGQLDLFVPLFVLLSIFTFSIGAAQAIFAYVLGDSQIRRHPRWFFVYGLHSMLWFGEMKNMISRVAQVKELVGERQWRVTPRTSAPIVPTVPTVAVTASTGTVVQLAEQRQAG